MRQCCGSAAVASAADTTDNHLTDTFLEKPQFDWTDYKTNVGDDSMKLLQPC